MSVYENIRMYLKEKGIMYSAVADKAGIRRDAFTGCMSGKRKISVDEYVRICNAVGEPLDRFANGVGNET